MRRDPDGAIVLSRRNLLTLLSKLEQPSSKRALYHAETGLVRVEEDNEHYDHPSREGAGAGDVNRPSEEFIRKHKDDKHFVVAFNGTVVLPVADDRGSIDQWLLTAIEDALKDGRDTEDGLGAYEILGLNWKIKDEHS